MNKQLLLSSLAAASLLAGCRVYLPGETPRRTVFGSDSSRATAEVPPARIEPAPAKAEPVDDLVAPQPVAHTAPAAPVATPAPALPPTAGADSYRNYIGGGGSGAASAHTAPAPSRGTPLSATTAPASNGGYRMYTVQAGDSAGMIANSNGMTLAEFAKLNNLSDPNKLRVGQTVKVATGRSALAAGPAARPAQPTAAPAGYVIVQEGDTLSAIAARNGTTVKALQEANNLSDANAIRSGAQLRLPGTPAPAQTAHPVSAQTAQGDVHPIPTTTHTVATIPTTTHTVATIPTTAHTVATIPTTTRPVATIPTTTRTPVRVTPDEASATPGGTVQAGDATIDVDAALLGGSLGAARQHAREAANQIAGAAQAAGDQAQSALGQVSDAAGRDATGVRDAVATPGTKEYVVEDGDDIYSIAMKFDSQPLAIRAFNGGKSLDDLKPGDIVIVPAK
jgi:LysM repeat protein